MHNELDADYIEDYIAYFSRLWRHSISDNTTNTKQQFELGKSWCNHFQIEWIQQSMVYAVRCTTRNWMASTSPDVFFSVLKMFQLNRMNDAQVHCPYESDTPGHFHSIWMRNIYHNPPYELLSAGQNVWNSTSTLMTSHSTECSHHHHHRWCNDGLFGQWDAACVWTVNVCTAESTAGVNKKRERDWTTEPDTYYRWIINESSEQKNLRRNHSSFDDTYWYTMRSFVNNISPQRTRDQMDVLCHFPNGRIESSTCSAMMTSINGNFHSCQSMNAEWNSHKNFDVVSFLSEFVSARGTRLHQKIFYILSVSAWHLRQVDEYANEQDDVRCNWCQKLIECSRTEPYVCRRQYFTAAIRFAMMTQ